MNNWKKVRLSELADITMGQSPKSDFYNSKGDGLPFLQGNRTFGDKYPTFDTWTTFVTKEAEVGDVIMSVRAPVGDINITPLKMCLGRGVCGLRHKQGAQEFLYYLLRANKENLINRENGTVFGSINKTDISNLEVQVPSLREQIQIGLTLKAIDDKIENNKKINHHLEQIAQAIFKSWFIDFDPFGGEKPSDWKTANLTDIAEFLNGLAMQKYRPLDNEESLPVLKIKELRQGIFDSSSDLCSANIKSQYIIQDGDVIFSWSGSLLVDFWTGGTGGLNQHLFKVSSQKYDKWFYYSWTKYYLEEFIAIAADKATTMGHITRRSLEKAKILIPNDHDYKSIGLLLAPIYRQIISNRIESRKLTEMRDTLLPKLLSGEISVNQATK
ncbi:restriction endonuclease subunit S [Streptococcus sanguinis]|uniref:restriction endonuclease subunit S n=1 Tax=Streptococcus sanguinis TaxID=1305 RepID=UPI002283E626|nr:restriction endonuclease subunit S [Streptococcus sanguinis]MCY7013104.1 restriction endonuclease subunit S [Streptococcus sanguinis]